ncbi:uncharacterized protein N0V89_010720 [Didymosphaeria variabile]|uniref:MFS general substrate transporter n=1 Tax=Didymosphaeria variabile TaxID=1932322 RepID=A0A9W8XC54_9PLEO|nr:uncharacterized protein N0V89_010720 [Didymosphaeria variabile]KAJ4346788.1 hypothetical protein N0V89_010720 [Didymosphaeria variabile]
MLDIIREAPLGQVIRFLSGNRLFQYPEDKPDFELPAQYAALLEPSSNLGDEILERIEEDTSARTPQIKGHDDLEMQGQGLHGNLSSVHAVAHAEERLQVQPRDLERTNPLIIVPQRTLDGIILVDWYTNDDPTNPKNWSGFKKGFVMFIVAFYTAAVYSAGPIYAASVGGGLLEHFDISPIVASLGLSLFVLAYGIGDIVFAPLCEIPAIGRNPVYYLTFVVFWAMIDDFGSLLALRFWMGFFGSPALANGGATASDLFELLYVPYGLSWFVLAAWCGPAFGPLIGGFAAMAKGWRWPLWEIVWISSLVLVILLTLMPETSAENILLRRARRLRKVTGNPRLLSQSEVTQRHMTASQILTSALVRPLEIMFKDPSVLFINVYTGFFYGVFYTFFEVFPLVFPPFYGFSLGQSGLASLSCFVGVIFALLGYFVYLHFYMIPDNKEGFREQEHRLVPAIVGSFLLPIGLFIFAWTAERDIHWVAPLIGVAIFCSGHFWLMQSLFIYLPFSYPKYAASLFAGNSLWRSITAGASVVFATPLLSNLGVSRGVSLLGGLSVVGIFGTVVMYKFGKQLRARSKYAQS